ncbi:hypothetical protein A9267_14875 [Shewanella sp. UCD-FRSSP16_17]|uniref:hypothetical protein n=1 Tax=Shewanella sp. UCD-FRSSP16_17 TaxID=1853256 RepID=UPI0007EEB9A5|nr:hypothetical protein [Shewanella sp. UCD-FRSSP16_17]OBT07146.1 hypothetical protein A9267_14875 [Shewanella sp. UCD-FRSSP16_17]
MSLTASPAKKRKGIYKFVVHEDVVFHATTIKQAFSQEETFLEINTAGDITVKGSREKGYAWDGCTPKVNCFDLCLLGVPDGRKLVNTGKPITYYASMVHDVLCQYRHEIPITRKQADDVFLYYLGDFQLRYLYYGFVRIFSIFSDMSERLKAFISNKT